MDNNIILRTTTKTLVPFIFMFGLYIQFHGEYSPGGGFQAGIICAAALIIYGLVHDLKKLQKIIPTYTAITLSSIGVLTYTGVGIITLLKGGKFLEYSVLSTNPVHGQEIGILIIEIGVGITVFSAAMLIFYMFGERSN